MAVFFQIISGLILLAMGRKLFWLFIALMGFLVGMELAGIILFKQPFWVILLVAIITGLLGAVTAVFAQRVAFALAGFFAGGYLVLIGAHSFGAYGAPELIFIVGGITGALLSTVFIDWAIIMLSSFAGAGIIVKVLALGKIPGLIVFVVLVSAGVFIQRWQIKERGKA
ncbi:MAG: hypothetical protein AMK71_08870 [Nitrospira bacterium SG8_35_4]|nr:MAG: hypothetical protein AMK71_08870 [Nitrospira bacterium SG8_35_4]